jgi:DNA-directed RNA polymerase specialized sigma24 family protein
MIADENNLSSLADAYPRLVAFARRRVGHEHAEDVAQEAILRVLRYKGNEDIQSVPFLLTIVHNVACDFAMSKKKCALNCEEIADALCECDGRAGSGSNYDQCWRELNERQREVLLLTEVKGLTEEQAAVVLGCSRSVINAQRRLAFDKIRNNCAECRKAG